MSVTTDIMARLKPFRVRGEPFHYLLTRLYGPFGTATMAGFAALHQAGIGQEPPFAEVSADGRCATNGPPEIEQVDSYCVLCKL